MTLKLLKLKKEKDMVAKDIIEIKGVEFAELLCAKFCHDLAGPIGAINNGIDFLDAHNEEMRKKAIDLVQVSSIQSMSKIAFFRQAYGFIPTNSELNFSSIKTLINNFVHGGGVSIEFLDHPSVLDSKVAKLLLNALLIVSGIIMYNGKISIKVSNKGSSKKIEIVGISSIYKVEQELINILKNRSESSMTTRNVQHFYTSYLAKVNMYDVDITEENGKVIFLAKAGS